MKNDKPLAFMSKLISARNLGLSTYGKEMVAIMEAIKNERHICMGVIL